MKIFKIEIEFKNQKSLFSNKNYFLQIKITFFKSKLLFSIKIIVLKQNYFSQSIFFSNQNYFQIKVILSNQSNSFEPK